MLTIKRALVSVSDKTHLNKLTKALHQQNIEIISTGGSAKHIQALEIPVKTVSQITDFPEVMGGRLKTLHPNIYGGILSRRSADDTKTTSALNIPLIDLVVVNLYPFESTINQTHATYADTIENIDIGGPAMLRAAAKNYQHVCVVADSNDYDQLIEKIQNGTLDETFRQQMAAKTFLHTAWYDSQIHQYLTQQNNQPLPERKLIALKKISDLRYGENPHQAACLYKNTQQSQKNTLIDAKKHQGKPLSFNNISDAQSAWQLAKQLPPHACVIVKHANPCSVAIGQNSTNAYQKAYQADPTSAFGGIIASNTTCDEKMAQTILNNQFAELIIAPSYTPSAILCFKQKPNVCILETPANQQTPKSTPICYQTIAGGLIAQTQDNRSNEKTNWETCTHKKPNRLQTQMLELGWEIVKFIKSNAIVLINDQLQSIGIGAGQTSRIDSVQIAIEKANKMGFSTQNCIAASDAFFPFADNIHTLAQAGIAGIIQPGGSVKDKEVIDVANQHNLLMLLTHKRHFLH